MNKIKVKCVRLRKMLLFITTILIMVIQYGCQQDDEVEITTHNKNSTDQPYTDVIKNDVAFAQAMSELENSNNFEKTDKETKQDFELDTETVRIIKRDNYTTYVLLVKRNQKVKNEFENLIIETAPEKATRYILIKYLLDKSHNAAFVADPESGLYAAMKIKELNSIANTTNKSECITLNSEMCMYGGTEHCAGPRCRTTYIITSIFCGDSSGTGGTTGDGGSGGYTGGTSGGSAGGTQTQPGGTATYLPPRVFIDENGDLVEDPYGYDEEMKEFLRLNPTIDAQIKEFLRTRITINDKIAANNCILAMMMNHQLNFNEALALYYYQRQNPAHADFLTQNESASKSIGAYLVANNSSVASVGLVSQMIIQMMHTGLSFDIKKSSKSPAFIDLSSVSGNSPEEHKFNEVYNVLITSPTFKNLFVNLFGASPLFDVKFTINNIQNTNGTNIAAQCQMFQAVGMRDPYNVIKVDRTFLLTKSNMAIAQAIIHECIHAYLNVKLLNPNIGMSISGINNLNFQECVNQYYNSFSGSQTQHTFFIDFMTPTLIQIFNEIKNEILTTEEINAVETPQSPATTIYQVNNSFPASINQYSTVQWNWNQLFIHLSFNGLQNTESFPLIYPFGSSNLLYLNQYLNILNNNFKP